jgi:hypothetical protein
MTEPLHFLPIPLKAGESSQYIVCRITGAAHSFPLTIVATDGDNAYAAERCTSSLCRR